MVIEKLKGIFKKKEEVKEEKEEEKILGTCPVCNQVIREGDEYKTINFQGTTYIIHIKCFRKMKKLAKKMIGKGIVPGNFRI